MTDKRTSRAVRGTVLSVVAAVALLAGIGAERAMNRVAPPDAEPYHTRVRESAMLMPVSIETWLGSDVPVPTGAVTLLKPNLLVARRFQDLRSDRRFTFLLVQCRDARDMLGHYPPVCYVAQGWRAMASEPKDWHVDDLSIRGMRYTFSSNRHELPATIIVENFMILPDGATCREMQDVERAARLRRGKFLGAAQVQFVFDPEYSESERDALVEMVVRANRETIDAIRQGS